MLAGACTGALRRRLPTGLPSMAGPPGHKSSPCARKHRVHSGGSRRPCPTPASIPAVVKQNGTGVHPITCQRLGEREQLHDGLLRSRKPHLDPPCLDRHALGEPPEPRLSDEDLQNIGSGGVPATSWLDGAFRRIQRYGDRDADRGSSRWWATCAPRSGAFDDPPARRRGAGGGACSGPMTRNQRVAPGTAAGISTIHASASVALTLWPSQIVPIALGFVTSLALWAWWRLRPGSAERRGRTSPTD